MTEFAGVARDYRQLHELLRRRAEALDIPRLALDEISGLPSGYFSKLLAPKPLRNMGAESLGLVLSTLALKLVVIEDDAAMRDRATAIGSRRSPNDSCSRVLHLRPPLATSPPPGSPSMEKRANRSMGKAAGDLHSNSCSSKKA